MDRCLEYESSIADYSQLEKVAEAAAGEMMAVNYLSLTNSELPLAELIPDERSAQRLAGIIEKKFPKGLIFTSPINSSELIMIDLESLRNGSVVTKLKKAATPNLLQLERDKKSVGDYKFRDWEDQQKYKVYTFVNEPKNLKELLASLIHIDPPDKGCILVLPRAFTKVYRLTGDDKEALKKIMQDQKIKYILSLMPFQLSHGDSSEPEGYIDYSKYI